MKDAVHTISVSKNGFPRGELNARQQDHVCFIQAGEDAPISVTVPANFLESGETECVVNAPNASEMVTYKVNKTAGVQGLAATSGTGNIKVSG